MDADWTSLLPPIVAIVLAIAVRQVLAALAAGVWVGALLLADLSPLRATYDVVGRFAVGALADPDHASIVVFSLLLGGLIGVITRAGGAQGLAGLATRWAGARGRAQVATWGMGLLVFFDDYANALLVGSSMRPITDRLRVSRAKLAFLVDATSAPVASLAVVSSWIGVEVGYIADQYAALGIQEDAYVVFLRTLPYRFYPWLMLFFALAVAWTGRDFGSMRDAEHRALEGEDPSADAGDVLTGIEAPPRPSVALLPIATLLVVATLGMYLDGQAKAVEAGLPLTLRNVFGQASAIPALLGATVAGTAVATAVALRTGALRGAGLFDAWLEGLRSMLLPCLVLVLAWSLAAVCRDLETARVLIALLGDGIAPGLLPAMVFLVAAAVSFATGTSWGTMAILFPLVVPLAHRVTGGDPELMLGSVSSILAGAVWGDHCSPISDTTLMSSLASGCDHLEHVRTQLPYALTVGVVSLVVGELGVGFGLYPPGVGLALGALLLAAALRFGGSRPVSPEPESARCPE